EIFGASTVSEMMAEIRDFQTTGVVSHARGTPFYLMKGGYLNIGSKRVQVNKDQIDLAKDAVKSVANRIS
ncbi:MAG: ParA family protein, partial [Pseudomonadota bacterium]